MTEISYFIGKTISSRQNLLVKRMNSSEGVYFLHIVPTKGRVMELETDSLFWLNRRVNTLTGVIHNIFNEDIKPEKYPDHTHIDQILRQLLIKKTLINRSMDPHGLAYFHSLFSGNTPNRDYPGICRNISGFFSNLYRNNYEDIYANDLGGRIIWQDEIEPGSADEKYALESDLLWLMGDYEELKREIKGYDDDDIFRNVRDFFKENNYPSYISSYNILILDGLTHISKIEEEILYHLIDSLDELWWLIDYDSDGDDPVAEFRKSCEKKGEEESGACRIYYSLASLMDRLYEGGTSYRIERAAKDSYPNPYSAALYTNKNIDIDDERDTLKIKSFPGKVDEVRAIASEIKRLILEQGHNNEINPGDIRVIFPDLNDYSSLVSEIFNEYGLPFSLTKGIPLSSHPLSHIFLKIFKLPLEGFRREDIFSLFSSRIINPDFLHFEGPQLSLDVFTDDHCLPGDNGEILLNLVNTELQSSKEKNPDIHLFDTVMRRCGINHLGRDLDNIKKDKISVFRDIYFNAISDTKSSDEKKFLRIEYYLFLYQRIIIESMLTPFTDLLNCKTPEKIVTAFSEIIRFLGFPANIIDINNRNIGFEITAKRGMLKRDIRAFSLLKELLTVCQKETKLAQRLFNIDKSDILLASFYDTFNNRINNRYLLDERNPDVIRVSQWLETRGRSFDYVFAGGLTAGRFPLKEEPDFIIPESSRGLFRIVDPVDQSKQLFSNLLKNYKRGLYLSYPENISEKPVQPSQVIQDLYALIFSGEQGDTDHDRLAWPANPFYTSGNELLNAGISKNVTGDTNSDSPSNLTAIIIKDSESEENIIRGIKASASRSAGNSLFEYDGLVGKASEFIQYSKERSKTFSSSSLETLANCPMKYLFQYVYKIKDLDDITPEATQKDIGQFAHEILNLFFKKLADLETNIYNLGIDRTFRIATQILEDHIRGRSILDRLDFAEFYKLELFSGLIRESMKDKREGIIASLFRYENTEFLERTPVGVEFEFGRRDKPVRLGNVFIKGYIDRFDRDINSPETVYIYDYKTGFIKSSSNIKKGLSFQLPVYIRALETLIKPESITAFFYSLKRNAFQENTPLKYPVYNYSTTARGLDIKGLTLLDDFAANLMQLISKGIFHHSTDGLTCEYCNFKYACHMDERRMNHLLEINPDLEIYSGKKNAAQWKAADDFKKEWKKICQSMDKAKTLKTESARKKHYETVIEYKNDLIQRRESLPFTSDYMESLLDEMERFQSGYDSQ